jgi:PTH1 family peptidyl-tRNA hydrolase
LAKRWGLSRWKREGPARATGGDTPHGRVHLLKPQTFMNNSGRAVSGLRPRNGQDSVPDLLMLVDDFAIPAGTMRLRPSGSAGGHNGLKSIEQALGTQQYARLRIGVGPVPPGMTQHDFVLERMPKEERRLVDDVTDEMAEAVECWMEEGIERAMARFNRKAKAEGEV